MDIDIVRRALATATMPSVRSAVTWGGIIAGGLLASYIGDRLVTCHSGGELVPALEYVPLDGEVSCVLNRLSEHKHVSPQSFVGVVESIDRFLCAHVQIVSGAISHPSVDDRSRVYLFYTAATESLGVFYTQCAVLNAESQARVHALYRTLYGMLEGRWRTILSKTTNI